MENLFKEYVAMWKNWSDFEGKADVRDYWMAWLINFAISILIFAIGDAINVSALSTIYSVAILVPSISIAVRRLHDTGKSGWYLLWMILPIIGWIMVIIALIKKA